MRFPGVCTEAGSEMIGPELVSMNKTDVRMGYLTLFLFVASLITVIITTLSTDLSLYVVTPVLVLPFLVAGVVSFVSEHRWVTLILIVSVTCVAYIIGPAYSILVLCLSVCSEGISVLSGLVQRLLFYRILTSVETINIRERRSVSDRVVSFMFNIPADLDARDIVMETGVHRKSFPWNDMLRTLSFASVPCAFLWIYIFLDPAFGVQTDGISVHILTIVLYIIAISMPWTIFGALDVRIVTANRDFGLSDGLMETLKRMFMPLLFVLVILGVALSVDVHTMCNALMSLAMVVIITVTASSMYHMHNQLSVIRDIVSKWAIFHPADLCSGYNGPIGKVKEDLPGTPERDPRSCFDRSGDQKY
ncbi:MAG: hypothetical protein ACI38Y_02685 [Candidatus Methanomethylophilaceae archaeon]